MTWSGSGPTPARSGGPGFRSRLALLAALAPIPAALAGAAWVDGPPTGHTGGFGEPTCAECHFAGSAEPVARLELTGAPASWEPGRTYRMTVALSSPGLERAGFQLSARFADGSCAGRPAGGLASLDERTTVAVDSITGVAYIHHTRAGTAPRTADSTGWDFEWTAPEAAGPAVVFHAAANAANGDDSALGDEIVLGKAESAGP